MASPTSSESGAVDARSGLTPQNERALRRLFEQVYSSGVLQIAEDLVTPDYVGYCAGADATYRGPAGLKSHATWLRAAFCGLRFDLDAVRETPDGIEVRWTATGRFERAIMGVEPACSVGRAGEEPGGPDIAVTGRSRLTMIDGKVRRSSMDWHLDEFRDRVGPSPDRRTARIARSVSPGRNPSP